MRFVLPIILIAISITAFFFYVNPMYTDVKALRASVADYDKALSRAKELQKTRDDLVSAYNAIPKDDIDRIVKFLPNSVDNIELILQIQQIASIHGMAIKDINFTPPAESDSEAPDPRVKANTANAFGVFELDFKTSASYDQFIAFLKDLEQNLRLIDTSSISFSVPQPTKVKTGVDLNTYDYAFKIKTYWLKH